MLGCETEGMAAGRPMAYAAGATDEIAHRLGQKRVHLGMNMAATALPVGADKSTAPDDVILYFGIIDILQVCLLTQPT